MSVSIDYSEQLRALAEELRRNADTSYRRGLYGLAQELMQARDAALSWADALARGGTDDAA